MSKPVVASYCTTFLKPEMLHVYRQVVGLKRFETFVLAKERTQIDRYPFEDVEMLPMRSRTNFLRRYWHKHVKGLEPLYYRGEARDLHSVLNSRRVDLMHIYFGHTAVHLLPFIKTWAKPCLVSFHGADVMPRPEYPRYIGELRRLLEIVPLVLARSHSLADRLVDLGCPKDKIRLNRTGIPLDEFPYLERPAPADGEWCFVQACRLIPKKGLRTTLKAFAIFLARNPKARLVIAGEGPMEKELRNLIGGLGVGHAVSMPGFLGQQELCALYHDAHIFVHPSRTPSDKNQEGVPNSMLEAMSTGLPVLATFHGGIPEAVTHGQTGLLVKEGDHEGLASQMVLMTQQPELWGQLGRAASASVKRDFEHSAAIERLEDCYQELLAARVSSSSD